VRTQNTRAYNIKNKLFSLVGKASEENNIIKTTVKVWLVRVVFINLKNSYNPNKTNSKKKLNNHEKDILKIKNKINKVKTAAVSILLVSLLNAALRSVYRDD
jgi:hypothetical protein